VITNHLRDHADHVSIRHNRSRLQVRLQYHTVS